MLLPSYDLPLDIFSPNSLEGITEHAPLQQRIEYKYLMPIAALHSFMAQLAPHYYILDINGKRRFNYTNWYFDTPNYSLYHQHVTAKAHRIKVRQRRYDDINTCYLEIKQKLGNGNTLKKRIVIDQLHEELNGKECELIDTYQQGLAQLQHVATNCFKRITLTHTAITERVTIDTNISTDHNGKSTTLNHLALIEIKQQDRSTLSYATQLLRNMELHHTSFSKYAVGLALLNKEVKYNKIKPTILKINKYETAR